MRKSNPRQSGMGILAALGAIGSMALIGALVWSFQGDRNTVMRAQSTNTGSISQAAPQPGDPHARLPGAPARP